MITVVAALIEDDGKLLVCQRKRGHRFEFMWEFPGGKIEAGETPRDALIRELREELGVNAQIDREVYRTRHRYAEMPDALELIFFSARADPAAIKNAQFEQLQWRDARSLLELDFLPADRELIALLTSGKLRLSRSSAGNQSAPASKKPGASRPRGSSAKRERI